MKRRRHTAEQIVRKLRAADRLLGDGQELPEVVKQPEVSEAPITAGNLTTVQSMRRRVDA